MDTSQNTTTQGLPEDVYYFAQLTETNHAGIILTVTIISLLYCLISSGVRFSLRRGIYGLDDAALLISTMACVVQHAFIFKAVSHGLGDAQYGTTMGGKNLANSTYIRIMLFFVVHCMAKVSLNLFVRRLFWGQNRLNQIACNILLGLNLSWGLVSILILSINCGSSWYFAKHTVCAHLMERWIVIKVLDVITELAMVVVPIFLLCRILLNRRQKYIILGTFAARLPVIVFSIMHYVQLRNSLHATTNRGLALVWPVVWLQFELLWSMVTASLPSFKPLISPFNTIVDDSKQQPSDPVISGALMMMGHSQLDKQLNNMDTWRSGSVFSTQLTNVDTVMSSSNVRADTKGHSETTIQGPKRRFSCIENKAGDIEMGQIRHEVAFTVTYETAKRQSRWSKMINRKKEDDDVTVEGISPAVREGEPSTRKQRGSLTKMEDT